MTPEGVRHYEQSHLPEAVPAEYFSKPFYAKVVGKYWSDDKITVFPEAMLAVIKEMPPQELLEFVGFFEQNLPETEEGEPSIEGIWGKSGFKDIVTDAQGNVKATIGHVNSIVEFVEDLLSDESSEWFLEVGELFDEELWQAAKNYKGEGFAFELKQLVAQEMMRREERVPEPIEFDNPELFS